MPSITQMAAFHKFCQQLSFSVLEQIYPREVVASLLSQDQAWEQRERKLNHLFLVYLLIVWSLSARSSLRMVCDRLLRPLRLSGALAESTPTSGAFCYRRGQLGVRVLRHLFRLRARPFAQAQTPGSFAFGLRLMGMDGTQFSVADSPHPRIQSGGGEPPGHRARALAGCGDARALGSRFLQCGLAAHAAPTRSSRAGPPGQQSPAGHPHPHPE